MHSGESGFSFQAEPASHTLAIFFGIHNYTEINKYLFYYIESKKKKCFHEKILLVIWSPDLKTVFHCTLLVKWISVLPVFMQVSVICLNQISKASILWVKVYLHICVCTCTCIFLSVYACPSLSLSHCVCVCICVYHLYVLKSSVCFQWACAFSVRDIKRGGGREEWVWWEYAASVELRVVWYGSQRGSN